MSRKVRHSFAAPLVVTLAVAPACVVRTNTPPPAAPPPGDGAVAPRPMVNPPPVVEAPPVDDRAPYPDGNPGTVGPAAPGNPQQGNPDLASWTVTIDPTTHSCYARIDVDCPPKPATCNPPPARKLASCPAGMAAGSPARIVEQSPDECYLQYAAPACPANVACNPPRPQEVACPR